MPNYSLRLPTIVEVAITKAKELLAFTTLPYYQVSGVLLSGEGVVTIGDPVAWNASVKKFLKFLAGETQVTAEAVGTGNGTLKVYTLGFGNIIKGSVAISVADRNPTLQVENVNYFLDYDTGYLIFVVAPENTKAITATYKWAENAEEPLGKCVGFVRIPGDSTLADVPIEVVIGGAVKYSVVSVGTGWSTKIIDDLKAKYFEIADALIF